MPLTTLHCIIFHCTAKSERFTAMGAHCTSLYFPHSVQCTLYFIDNSALHCALFSRVEAPWNLPVAAAVRTLGQNTVTAALCSCVTEVVAVAVYLYMIIWSFCNRQKVPGLSKLTAKGGVYPSQEFSAVFCSEVQVLIQFLKVMCRI